LTKSGATDRKRRRQQRAERARRRGIHEKKKKGVLREWGEALLFAVIFMTIVRTLFFDLFRIPTPSMEKNLLVGDYIFVSKLHYGTRTPITLGIPFTQIHLKNLELPWTRLPGFSEVKRGDALVFNWPADPSGRLIDRKMHYIKRVVGLPGETIEIKDKIVSVNGAPFALGEGMQQEWLVFKEDPAATLNRRVQQDFDITAVNRTNNPRVDRMVGTSIAAEKVGELSIVNRVEPLVMPSNGHYSAHMYPAGKGYSPDNYGPVTIPRGGQTVTLTHENWPVYEPVIQRYESSVVRRDQERRFMINGEYEDQYTFEQDYFFVMGDNRDNSEDSRYWGFVPMDHVVGKAVLVYFSWDAEGSPPIVGQVRYGRLGSPIRAR